MLPLGNGPLPVDARSLADSIRRGFASVFDLGPAKFSVDGGGLAWPSVGAIAIDLTHANGSLDRPDAPDSKDVVDPIEVSAGSIRLFGKPIQFDDASVALDLSTQAARIRLWHEKSGRGFWSVASAGNGSLHLDVLVRDLESMLMTIVRPLAEKERVDIRKVNLTMRPIDDRSLSVEIVITAGKSIFSAVLHVGGTLALDDHLNARLDRLTCRGEGMIGSAAAAMVRPKLEEVFREPIALASVLGPGIKLNQIKLGVTDRVTVDARWE
jgi:hypothetical protein